VKKVKVPFGGSSTVPGGPRFVAEPSLPSREVAVPFRVSVLKR